jgi:type I restriction enzyme R subunit
MTQSIKSRLQVFDPKEEYLVVERRLPHWSQAGTIAFITWRTCDSMPKAVLKVWLAERDAWLQRHGIDPFAGDWRTQVTRLSPDLLSDFRLHIADRWNEHLDDCHGECVLGRSDLSAIVVESLQSSDGQRYDLTDFVVMPNHTHILAAFPNEQSMLKQCEGWKRYTGTKLNKALGRAGRFWQQDGFDHLVRSIDEFERLRSYIANNPARARLREGEYAHWSKTIS